MKHCRSKKNMTKKTKDKSSRTVSEISSPSENQTLNQHKTENPGIWLTPETEQIKIKSTEINDLKNENKYLKLLLGVSHNVDTLLGELRRNFTLSDALSSPEAFRRCLCKLERSKEIEIFVQTVQHILQISNNLSDHKKHLLSGGNLFTTDSLLASERTGNTESVEDNISHPEENFTIIADDVTLNESKDPSWTPPGAVGRLEDLPRLNNEELSPLSRLGLQLSDLVIIFYSNRILI